MAKSKFTDEDDALLAELGIKDEAKKAATLTPREGRIIAGFEEIERFVEQHGHLPQHGEEKDIFERLYAVRLEKIKESAKCRAALEGRDPKGLLDADSTATIHPDDMDDEALLAELGVAIEDENDITKLTHVKTRAEKRAAEEIAQRTTCTDFEHFKPLFRQLQEDLSAGLRRTREFKDNASIKRGEFFILGGQKVYVAEMGEEFINDYDRPDRRLRVIYDNGTESDILLRSLQRALNKDETGRRISDPSAGPLFADDAEEGDIESGTIYVLRSKSDHPEIQTRYEVLHKIGVTGGKVEKRIANAKHDATFLLSDVEIVATYKLSNINRVKLENLIHRFFEPARFNIEIKDRFGKPFTPREWFIVPLFIIDQAVKKIKDGSIVDFVYEPDECVINRK